MDLKNKKSKRLLRYASCIKMTSLKNGIGGLIKILLEDVYMERIKNIWFDCGRLFMRSMDGNVYSRPLEAFPELLEASAEHRSDYKIDDDGEAIRWEAIDVDLHISSFFDKSEPDTNNPVADLFRRFPWLNPAEVANAMDINKNLLAKYIYGITAPSPERLSNLKSVIHALGKEMLLA